VLDVAKQLSTQLSSQLRHEQMRLEQREKEAAAQAKLQQQKKLQVCYCGLSAYVWINLEWLEGDAAAALLTCN
jgi:hypothetical protein